VIACPMSFSQNTFTVFACVLRAPTEGRCVKRKMFLAFGFSFFPLKLKNFRLSGKICFKNGKKQ